MLTFKLAGKIVTRVSSTFAGFSVFILFVSVSSFFYYYPCPVPLVLAVSHHFTFLAPPPSKKNPFLHRKKERKIERMNETQKQTQYGTCRYIHDKKSETKKKQNFNVYFEN
jgi:hypothetical protein